jgi:hypothetical protein
VQCAKIAVFFLVCSLYFGSSKYFKIPFNGFSLVFFAENARYDEFGAKIKLALEGCFFNLELFTA